MFDLDTSTIRLGARAASKEDAIRAVGGLLVEAGRMKPGYVQSMLAREKVANTYLGNGIAIPHGLPKDRGLILETGVAVLQLPDGVEWNPGETVRLVIGIAARSDEHIEVLTNLTRVLDDPAAIERLSRTESASEIVAVLTGRRAAAAAAAAGLEPFQRCVDVPVPMSSGLHARPAAAFAEVAKRFEAEVRVQNGPTVANAKSLISLLMLGAGQGSVLRIMARGPDEVEALAALKRALESGLGDMDEPAAEEDAGHRWVPKNAAATVPGLSAAPGLAIGPLHQLKHTTMVVESTARDQAVEAKRLREAIAAARADLEGLHREVEARSGAGRAGIFRAHVELLEDPALQEATLSRLRQGHSAGWAWRETVEAQARGMETLSEPLLAARAVDLRDVGTRVLRLLSGALDDTLELPERPVLLVAEDLAPSDTARLDPAVVLGLCTALGGPTSHTAILARSLGIPAVVGAGPAVLHQPEGATAVLDGSNGVLYVEPDAQDLEAARSLQVELRQQRGEEHRARFEPAVTRDGHRVEVLANAGLVSEAAQAVHAGGEGIGLLRTEFLFLGRDTAPSEDEQYGAYAEMVRALNGLPLILRTLDVGGDKQVPYLDLPHEDNPFLGMRGIRLCLARPELFLTQLRAVYRTSKHGPIRLMFPMIASLDELRAARALAERARGETGAAPLEIGIMIEVPAAVEMADLFARESDFFSVGTNDLTQYVLAMDRSHPLLSAQADGLHPAVLRMIQRAVRAMTDAGKWVGVCGGIAGDPLGAAILTGLGVAELSVSIPAIPAIKARIRKLSLRAAQDLAGRALQCSSAAEVRRLGSSSGRGSR
jgi:multiphosphoryl transfer protein